MRFSCPSCKSELEMSDSLLGREIDCPVCKTKFVCRKKDSSEGGLMDALTSVVGVERLKGFSWREFVSEIFKRHSDSEVEKYFMVGTETTTPDIFGVKIVWPKPGFLSDCLSPQLVFITAWRGCGTTGAKRMHTISLQSPTFWLSARLPFRWRRRYCSLR